MTIVFWVILIAGSISAMEGNKELNRLCDQEIKEGISETIQECRQYQFDTRVKKGW